MHEVFGETFGSAAVRVPVVTSHSEAVHVETREPITPERARTLFAADAGFIQEGGVYTATAVVTDGSRFVVVSAIDYTEDTGAYYVLVAEDGTLIEKSLADADDEADDD